MKGPLLYTPIIDEAWENLSSRESNNRLKPVVVQIYSVPGGVGHRPVLQYQEVLQGQATTMSNEIMPKKAFVVAMTGLRVADAVDRAAELQVNFDNWLPDGTWFSGAAPVTWNGTLQYVVVVSGQNHENFDQPLVDEIAAGMEEWYKTHSISIP